MCRQGRRTWLQQSVRTPCTSPCAPSPRTSSRTSCTTRSTRACSPPPLQSSSPRQPTSHTVHTQPWHFSTNCRLHTVHLPRHLTRRSSSKARPAGLCAVCASCRACTTYCVGAPCYLSTALPPLNMISIPEPVRCYVMQLVHVSSASCAPGLPPILKSARVGRVAPNVLKL